MAMKPLARFIIFALLACFYGCQQNDVDLDLGNEVILRSVSTRSVEDNKTHPLPAGAEVGVFATLPNNYSYFASNLQYISDGNILVAAADKLELPDGATSAMVYAYAPYSATNVQYGMLEIAVETDQNANGTAASDILWGSGTIESKRGVTTLTMERKMSLIRINITSKAGVDLSDAKVELLNLYCSARMNPQTGVISSTSYTPSTIRAQLVGSANYEAIILPHSFYERTDFIRVTLRSKSYIFTTDPKIFEAGKAYDFDITVRDDVAPPLSCSLTVTYDNKALGNTLTIPASVKDKPISIKTYPQLFSTYKLRNESGGECWAKIISIGVGNPDQINEGDMYSNLRFSENFGPERQMTLEFYDITQPRSVYKQVVVTQQAAADYLNLSTQTISADKMGTVYDIPFEVNVASNLAWTIDNANSWVDVKYTEGVKNQLIMIDLPINTTGTARSGVVRFMADGREIKRVQITQSAVENPTFTLRYELNIDIATYGNWFVYQGKYYPDELHMFNYYPAEFGDATAKIQTSQPYGFVVDAPIFNKIEVRGFRHGKFLTVRNYSGRATTIHDANLSVTCYRIGYPFFRSFRVDFPIPAGVKRHQMVRFDMQFVDTQHIMYYPVPAIKTTVFDQ